MPLIDFGERDVDKWTLRTVVERGALAFESRKCWHLAQLDLLWRRRGNAGGRARLVKKGHRVSFYGAVLSH